MLKTPRFLLTASLALALAFTLSCSNDDGDDPQATPLPPSYDAEVSQPPSSSSVPSSSPEEAIPMPTFGLLLDNRDDHEYKTVVIGTQTWMAENLNYYVPFCGRPSYGQRPEEDCVGLDQLIEKSVCVLPKNAFAVQEDNEYCQKYGRAYTWAAAMKACPDGWHLPSDDDWKILINYVNGDKTGNYVTANNTGAGPKLKAKEGWENNPKYPNGTDNYGFSALPGGYVNESGRSWSLGVTIRFWSSGEHPSWATQPPEKIAVARNVAIMGDDLRFNPNSTGITYDGAGHSVKHEPNYVRCIQDE
ncbi:MAG: hypothetical protein LBQ87_02005 [Candidatus Fibromonas sp.]|nr:hypothetical protein [Candidatus Fibromonas sp.]